MTTTLVAMIALIGCKPKDGGDETPGVFIDLSAPTGIVIDSTIGQMPVKTLVRSVNAVGSPVIGSSASVTFDGAPTTVTFDGTGYGQIELDRLGSAKIESGDQTAWIHAVASDWQGMGLGRSEVPRVPVTHAAPAHKGFLVADAQSVWWVAPGETPYTVLVPDAPIVGMRTANIDLDGVLDAVVWAGDTVYMLKGRSQGGMSFGAAVQAEGYAAIGADVADLDAAGGPDVVIAWVGSTGPNHVQLLLGDGLWGFESRPPKTLYETPTAIAAGDNVNEGTPQVTVLESTSWERFAWSMTDLVEVGPTLSGAFMETVSLEGSVDLNGDGGDELVFLGPLVPNQNRELRIYDLVGANPQILPLQPPEGYIALTDTNNDAMGDLLMSYKDGSGVAVTSDGGTWTQKSFGDLGVHGPLAATDLDGDAIPEVFVAGTDWRFWTGGMQDDSNGIPRYHANGGSMLTTTLSVGPIAAVDVDHDPATTELLGVQVGTTSSSVVRWTVAPGTPPTVVPSTGVALPGGPAPAVDIAVCGDVAWVLTTTAASRIDLQTDTLTAGFPITDGRKIACGAGPNGAAAAVLATSDVKTLGVDAVVIDTIAAPNASDVALIDLGAGGEMHTCDTAGCGIVAWPFSPTESALVWGDATTLHATRANGDEADLAMPGVPSLADVDGDGNIDLLAVQTDGVTSTVGAWRSTGEFWGPAETFHAALPFTEVAAIGDAGGDGIGDVWAVQADGTIAVSAP